LAILKYKEDILKIKIDGKDYIIPCLSVNKKDLTINKRVVTNIMNFAHGIVYISNSIGITITNLKLQKLLSEVQIFYKRNDIEIFSDEPSLWRHGLVYPEVYGYYRAYFNEHIGFYDEDYVNELNDEDLIIIEGLIMEYKDLDSWEMVRNNLGKIRNGYFNSIIKGEV